MAERDLHDIARRQHGLVTRRQASEAGLSERAISRRLETGAWRPERAGVYALPGVPPSYQQSVLAAVLAAGEGAWTSHRTAARLHGTGLLAPAAIDILTRPDRRVRLAGVDHHRSGEIRPKDVTALSGIPITSIGRTLTDCLPWLGERGFARALDDARRRGLITPEDAEDAHHYLDRGRRTGRHKVVPGRRPIQLRVDGQQAGGSNREIDVLRVLEDAGLPLPEQQYEVQVAGRQRMLDFAYPGRAIGIEWDGFAEHGLIRATFDDDRIRDSELQLLGWLMLHVTSETPPGTLVRWVRTGLAARSTSVVGNFGR